MSNIGEENEQIEFKKSTGELKEGVISIASILNKHGSGELYYGVKNNGDVIGQDVSDKTLREISQAIADNIKPALYPVIEKKNFDGKSIAYVKFEGSRAPYTAYNVPRIRVADEDKVMDQDTYRDMLNARENRTDSWETKLSKYHVNDIDREVFEGYLRKARKVGRIALDSDDPLYVMTKLELAQGDVLLNAGAALFVNCGINELQMARFASDERLTFNDIKRYTGSILELADKAILYVADAMDWRVEFDGSTERKEFPEIPMDAVREAVINAFGHRIIESAQSVEVAIYKSFIEIYSPGKFPDNVTPEQFITEIRKPIRRNPLITRTLYYSKDMESFATGLKRISDACNTAGVKVEFYGDDYGFTVRFYRHCGEVWGDGQSMSDIQKDIQRRNVIDNVTENDIEVLPIGISKLLLTYSKSKAITARNVAYAIKEDEKRTLQQIAEVVGITKRSVARYTKEFQDAGVLHREGSDTRGKWILS